MNEQHRCLAETLADILDAVEANHNNPGPSRASSSEKDILDISEVMDEHDRAVDYQRDPVGRSLRAGMRDLMRRMSAFCTYAEYSAITDYAVRRSGFYQFRVDVVDKRSDGLTFKDGEIWVA